LKPEQGLGITKALGRSIPVEGTEQLVVAPGKEASGKESGSPETGGKRAKSSAGSRKVNQEQAGMSDIAARKKVDVTLQSLLEAGAHFGHQTARWSPTMAPYIYTSRNGIHIINLPKTVQCWDYAKKAIENIVGRGGNVLFVGTKKQAQDAVVEEARRCGAFFVSRRWLGGMLTNFQTIRKSIERMNKLDSILKEEETALAEGTHPKFTKKERLMMSREREKLEFSLGGIKDMHSSPSVLFVIDIKREEIAIKEARRLDIPVIALVDTNCDPKSVNYPIPSNDDGSRVIRLFCSAVADAILEGKKVFGERKASEPAEGRKGKAQKVAAAETSAPAEPSASEAQEASELEAAPVESTGEAQ